MTQSRRSPSPCRRPSRRSQSLTPPNSPGLTRRRGVVFRPDDSVVGSEFPDDGRVRVGRADLRDFLNRGRFLSRSRSVSPRRPSEDRFWFNGTRFPFSRSRPETPPYNQRSDGPPNRPSFYRSPPSPSEYRDLLRFSDVAPELPFPRGPFSRHSPFEYEDLLRYSNVASGYHSRVDGSPHRAPVPRHRSPRPFEFEDLRRFSDKPSRQSFSFLSQRPDRPFEFEDLLRFSSAAAGRHPHSDGPTHPGSFPHHRSHQPPEFKDLHGFSRDPQTDGWERFLMDRDGRPSRDRLTSLPPFRGGRFRMPTVQCPCEFPLPFSSECARTFSPRQMGGLNYTNQILEYDERFARPDWHGAQRGGLRRNFLLGY
ncbi:hypothetical protein BV898_00680 [Hypsibius exemplaris]|uniref:Uncharacterized protein n=1 Tax=Hypsibius exemplaris TaxID=2072580 RepID=A0A1W0XEH0_HYPEX|nr:hypothetical protein BV898_00680 [Hypsibius exemplaris]